MSKPLYQLATFLMSSLFSVFFWVKPKWKLRYQGLKNQRISRSSSSRLWFHCASAGEYEQIAEVIDYLSKAFPQHPVFISFYSPSGIEWMKIKNIQWEHGYLPFDGSQKMRKFIEQLNPKCLVIAKNEFWPNMLEECSKKGIPSFMVSAKINESFIGLKNSYFRNQLAKISHVFTQDKKSESLLKPLVKSSCEGDTRISRIHNKWASKKQDKTAYTFEKTQEIIVYGSVHESDLGVLSQIKELNGFNHIVVPHEVDEKSLAEFKKLLGPNPQLSSQTSHVKSNVLLMDEMGKLSSLYKLSDYAYIGGGFSEGIHNTIEPLICKNIVFIGPTFNKFQEAVELVNKKVVQLIQKPDEFARSLKTVVDLPVQEKQNKIKEAMLYIENQKDSAKKVFMKIQEYIK